MPRVLDPLILIALFRNEKPETIAYDCQTLALCDASVILGMRRRYNFSEAQRVAFEIFFIICV